MPCSMFPLISSWWEFKLRPGQRSIPAPGERSLRFQAPRATVRKHIGAKTVNRWREEFLRDFAERMDRCARPAP